MFDPYIKFFSDPTMVMTFKYLYYTAFIWVPVILGWALWDLWVDYRRAQFFAKTTYILLEIKLPREMFKSPLAAEFFISGLWTTLREASWFEKYWKGQVRQHFSLEMVSIDGGVHFFIWCEKGSKNQIEANLYSQFPGIEIYEVPDYTLPMNYNPEVSDMFATEFDLTKPDAFPIKTYLDYGMDKDPKEEFKIDPLTPLIEALGSLGKGHQAWIQIIVRAHKDEDPDPDKPGKFIDNKWKKDAEVQIDKILAKSKGEKGEDGKIIPGSTRFLTKGETDTVAALERSISKNGFDTGIRLIYTAPKDIFSMSNVGGLVGGIMHFNSNSLNGFKTARGAPPPKYKPVLLAWKDRPKKKIYFAKRNLLNAYKRRAYFYRPFKSPHFVLNTEELATMYHFPGGVSTTPTFARIGSKKAEAPSNLPS